MNVEYRSEDAQAQKVVFIRRYDIFTNFHSLLFVFFFFFI